METDTNDTDTNIQTQLQLQAPIQLQIQTQIQTQVQMQTQTQIQTQVQIQIHKQVSAKDGGVGSMPGLPLCVSVQTRRVPALMGMWARRTRCEKRAETVSATGSENWTLFVK